MHTPCNFVKIAAVCTESKKRKARDFEMQRKCKSRLHSAIACACYMVCKGIVSFHGMRKGCLLAKLAQIKELKVCCTSCTDGSVCQNVITGQHKLRLLEFAEYSHTLYIVQTVLSHFPLAHIAIFSKECGWTDSNNGLSVGCTISPPLWFRLTHLNNSWMDCHDYFGKNIHFPQRMNSNDLNDALTFPPAPTCGCHLRFSVKCLDKYWMDCYEIWQKISRMICKTFGDS